jgi:hypothetical protein
MFNQKDTLDIEDFLEAIGFVAPPGYDVNYFVVPRGQEKIFTQTPGFTKGESLPEDETITYHQTPPDQKHDTAESPSEYSIWEARPLGRRLSAPHPLPRVTDPSELKSPFVKMINESTKKKISFRLTEDVYPFRSGTLFFCSKKRLKEGWKAPHDGRMTSYELRLKKFFDDRGTKAEDTETYKESKKDMETFKFNSKSPLSFMGIDLGDDE